MPAKNIQVAGDVCIDVIGVPQPPPAGIPTAATENWRLAGEIRTHYSRGGALLLADMIGAAVGASGTVSGSELQMPDALLCGQKGGPLDESLFIRLTREEIVHSILRADEFKRSPEADKKDKALRVARREGFSGPAQGPPAIQVRCSCSDEPDLIVLDDTGNSFRHSAEQWPAAVTRPGKAAAPIILHKLHRPLPVPAVKPKSSAASPQARDSGVRVSLWDALKENHPLRRVVVLSVDDLRNDDMPVSRGLSWERTALDLVWHLKNQPRWQELRETPHLLIRLGLDGAIYWHCSPLDSARKHHAWLAYNPSAIEGDCENSCEGQMVAYGSAFTAGVASKLVSSADADPLTCTHDEDGVVQPPGALIQGIFAGIRASQRLLKIGFGAKPADPAYPLEPLFAHDKKELYLACQPIPILEAAAVPDRGYWRLIDSIFAGKTKYLHRAVSLTARNIREGGEGLEDEDKVAQSLLRQVPVAVFAGALRAYDRREIESYRALYSLMFDYVRKHMAARPLSVAVFGPPGAGKSFGVKMVARALATSGTRAIQPLTFNLSQYRDPGELAAVFHLVRDIALSGKIPLVFFDEFDAALNGQPLGWLRYFLGPMQDGEFVDRGEPHPIGQSIFVFAGGTCGTYADFARPFTDRPGDKAAAIACENFKSAKGPDFLSRLRGTLDIPGLDLDQEFDAYGPTEAFPCEAAILLRRANILAFQLREKAPGLEDRNKALKVSEAVIRALLHLPRFAHGNRSFEALLDMSHLVGEEKFTPSLLPATGHAALHADAGQLMQLLGTDYPYPDAEREQIARAIHNAFVEDKKKQPDFNPADSNVQPWDALREDYKESNRQQADHIAVKLQSIGLWFRTAVPDAPAATDVREYLRLKEDRLAETEHDRWVAEKRRAGWIPGPGLAPESRNDSLLIHNFLFPWDQLTDDIRNVDRLAVRRMPDFLGQAGYEIFAPLNNDTKLPTLNSRAATETAEF